MSETEGYILNTVQTPAPLQTVYRSIKRGNTTKESVQEDTDLPENLLSQGFGGLQQIGLIGREEPDYYTIDYPWETGDDDLNFRLAALHQLASSATPDSWGKQSVVLLNYQYLLEENIQTFKSNAESTYSRMNRFARERGYEPRSQQGPIDMNEPKMINWSRLARFLGLIYKASGRVYTTYPDEELIYESIRLASNAAGRERITIQFYEEWLNDNLLLVDMGPDGVPAPLSRVLFNLVADDRIRIVESGDAGAINLQQVPIRRGIDSQANSIEVLS
ncbi:hypothetical protein [Haloprofundus sp. MHR1]|uniref:hypothetical protein n=1 Tax=Haloprofundus sp. MHR1 TaxID=2572921 RepID=UPI0010BEAA4A|nr:hypothetical protein [Haloprofundus sp. MHR1]QCJ45653.1 hypothetical protein FCF25_00285 [Haloprofundus sp. MHR1]